MEGSMKTSGDNKEQFNVEENIKAIETTVARLEVDLKKIQEEISSLLSSLEGKGTKNYQTTPEAEKQIRWMIDFKMEIEEIYSGAIENNKEILSKIRTHYN